MADEQSSPKPSPTPEQMFARALGIASDPAADVKKMRFAADTLVAFGALDEADTIIQRLEQKGSAVPRLKAAANHIRRSGVLRDYRAVVPDGNETQLAGKEVLVSRAKAETDRLIVVFSGRAKRFWVSLDVLNRFLQPYGTHIVNLTDYSGLMFFNGLPKTAPGYEAMLDLVRAMAADLHARRLFLMANSGGGFIGLRAAADLGAESFLGLSIRTDFSRHGSALENNFATSPLLSQADPELLMDLRPYLAERKHPLRGLLLSGDGNAIDAAHANHLRGLTRFEVVQLKNYAQHDVVSGLLARGKFEPVLARFMGEAARGL